MFSTARVIRPCATKSVQKYRVRSVLCQSKPLPTIEDVAQQTLAIAYKPIVDVLERIEKKLDTIEKNMGKSKYVERPNGEIVKLVDLDKDGSG